MTATRPTVYTPEIGEELCRRLSDGSPLGRILRDAGMPARGTVRRWQCERPDFAAAYAGAREDLIEALADDALELADYARADDERAVGASTAPDAATRKIYIDTVKWYAGVLAPRRASAAERPAAEEDEDRSAIGEAIERGRERVRRLREQGLREQNHNG